jgi:hypothetical protein
VRAALRGGPRGYDERRVRLYLPFRNLVVWVPDRYDLLFMKAARASGHDVAVLTEMHRSRPFDLDLIIDRFNSHSRELPGPTVQRIIQRLFGEIPHAVHRLDYLTRL